MSSVIASVVIFIMTSCPACHKTMEYMDSKHIKYTVKNIQTDSSALKEFSKAGHRSTPQVYIDGKYVGGMKETIKYLETHKS